MDDFGGSKNIVYENRHFHGMCLRGGFVHGVTIL